MLSQKGLDSVQLQFSAEMLQDGRLVRTHVCLFVSFGPKVGCAIVS